mmetsp:Transcript_38222/g.89580  ORF Transcript_38222/g.89580 Transcript_38222/m.89580 type:complete len:264 (-) Transcript_38222:1608-2399(-)
MGPGTQGLFIEAVRAGRSLRSGEERRAADPAEGRPCYRRPPPRPAGGWSAPHSGGWGRDDPPIWAAAASTPCASSQSASGPSENGAPPCRGAHPRSSARCRRGGCESLSNGGEAESGGTRCPSGPGATRRRTDQGCPAGPGEGGHSRAPRVSALRLSADPRVRRGGPTAPGGADLRRAASHGRAEQPRPPQTDGGGAAGAVFGGERGVRGLQEQAPQGPASPHPGAGVKGEDFGASGTAQDPRETRERYHAWVPDEGDVCRRV